MRRPVLPLLPLVTAFAAAIGCSAADPGVPYAGHPSPGSTTPAPTTTNPGTPTATGTGTTPPPPTTSNETWADGKQIASSIVIGSGATVTIADGATVTLAAGATITVQGTLKGTSTAAHAKLTGASWGGIVIDSGGTMALDGVDLVNGAALVAKTGSKPSTWKNGTMTAPMAPFTVEKTADLSIAHVNVTGTKGESSVAGSLAFSYVDYDANGNGAIMTSDASAVLTIDDSKIHGPGPTSSDLITGGSAASIHLAHTEISGSHCAFHFSGPTAYDLSYLSIHDNSYGFMLYGSGSSGTRSITKSNIFKNGAYGADEGTGSVNGPITISDGYWAENASDINKSSNAITVTNMSSTTPVPGVGPR